VTVAKKGKEADAKSILSVLGLGIERNDTVTVAADGDGADDLLDSLESVLSAEGA
jgi:phosphocarrier protein